MRWGSRLLLALAWAPALTQAAVHVVIVEGLGGDPRYTEAFATQVDTIVEASASVADAANIRVFRAADGSREEILAHFSELDTTLGAADQLVVYFVGHGSYDDYDYKFNIRGPDLTGADIAAALGQDTARRQLFVNTSSASGALGDLLEADSRVTVLATKSGVERHATRYGSYFAEALASPVADTNKDQAISAREAHAFAERRVADYFERESRLSTEHSRLDGALADRFIIARLGTTRAAPGSDARLAELLGERDALNADIDALRLERDGMQADEYRAELLQRMLELARLEDAIEARREEIASD